MDKDIKTEIALLKQAINIIKTNHLSHMTQDIDNLQEDMTEIKTEIFKFKYIAYGAIVVFVLMSEQFNDILRLL